MSTLQKVPKIKFESNPTQWEHHRGGWSYVLGCLKSLEAHDGMLFVSAVEEVISDKKIIDEPWIGFIHQVPKNNYRYYPDLNRLVKDEYFLKSLGHCQGIFVLSHTVKDYLQAHLHNVSIAKVLYPLTPFPLKQMFSWANFENKVVFIGEFLRNFQAFYDLKVPNYLQKILLKSSDVNFDKLYDCNLELIHLKTNDSVLVKEERISDKEYDEILSSSIVFLNLYDAPANTTVIECIGRNTPLVVNRLPGIEEYLGKDYPLFYDTLDEATKILGDMPKLMEGTLHLNSLSIKERLTKESFISSFTNSVIYRSLPIPPSQANVCFPRYDITVVICCYKRVYNLKHQLICLLNQDFDGSFEVIIWNNNHETQKEVSDITSPYMKTLNIRLIQSSENYYCIIRLAVSRLMYSNLLLICDDDVVPYTNYISTFIAKYQQYGPRAVLCCRGHVFASHTLNEENPQKFWEDYENIKFFDESLPDRQVILCPNGYNLHFLILDTFCTC